MTIRVAINGFGRIGELFFRNVLRDPGDIEVVAINDTFPLPEVEYLLRFDSVHHEPTAEIASGEGWLRVNGRVIQVLQVRDPAQLPWRDLGIDIVVEATGVFEDRAGMEKHRQAGALKVLLTAPAKADGADVTLCYGVNEAAYDPARHHLVSNASCTTNCLAPVARALDAAFGLEWGLMSTVHAYTGTQALVDRADKDLRRGRAAALNIVPSSTGAARAIGLVLPHLKGRLDGMSFRVPVPTGSVIDLVFETRAPFTADSLHAAFEAAERDPSYHGVLTVTRFPLVSSDIIGRPDSAIVDTTSTLVMGDRRGKVVAFYDNEWGYACRVTDVVRLMGAGLGRGPSS
jgi:glyceraldehyde 3-phosphate dehydrogenase